MGRPPRLDLIGQRFGRLIALAYEGNRKWACRCDCGQDITARRSHLLNGSVQSCGCLQKDLLRERSTTHGHYRNHRATPEYYVWAGMKARCMNPRHPAFKNYGGRGITVCDRWLSFAAFLADVGPRPQPTDTLDRIDNAHPYEPGNVRWVPWIVQLNNMRTNRHLTHDGQTLTVAQWARQLGLTDPQLRNRLKKGWSVHRALTEPSHTKSR